MNKNKLLNRMPQEVGDAYHEFQSRYFLHNSLTLAAGFAIGVIAVKAFERVRAYQDIEKV